MKILLPLILLAAATSAFAADPFEGNWKQSNDLSGGQIHVQNESPPILKIEVNGDIATIAGAKTLEYALDGSPTRLESGDDRSLKRVHSNVWHYYHDLHGKVQAERRVPTPFVQEGHYSVSHDGKVLTMAILRTYADGETRYYFRVFEKQ